VPEVTKGKGMTRKKIKIEQSHEYTCDGCEKIELVTSDKKDPPPEWFEFYLDDFYVFHRKSKKTEASQRIIVIKKWVHACSYNCLKPAMANVTMTILDKIKKEILDKTKKETVK
jgi:hypothetical protein